MALSENLANRKWLLAKLRAEIVGPDPIGAEEELAPGSGPKKFTWVDFRKPKRQPNGEEVIWQDPPAKRYGAGILYPLGVDEAAEQTRAVEGSVTQPELEPLGDLDIDEKFEKSAEKKAAKAHFDLDESEDYAVTLSNAHKPSAIGISFLADLALEADGFKVELVNVSRSGGAEVNVGPCGTYKKVTTLVGDSDREPSQRTLYLRAPLLDGAGKYPFVDFSVAELLSAKGPIRRSLGLPNIRLEVVVVARSAHVAASASVRLITVSVINRNPGDEGNLDEHCLFQAGIRVSGSSGALSIQPYRETDNSKAGACPMSDEQINRLLYRYNQTFAIGHGCAADWHVAVQQSVSAIWTDVMPAFETPSTSADLFVVSPSGEKQPIRVSMRKLAGLDRADDGLAELQQLTVAYERWITSLKDQPGGIAAVPGDLHETAVGLVERCEACLVRIRDGIEFLSEQSDNAKHAREAFRFSNHAMLIAQLRATSNVRTPVNKDGVGLSWSAPIADPDPAIPDLKRGYWRAFQIAFLLMSIRGIAEPESHARETVDLIWFPTGGGKTEAYLGLTAFTIFFNQLAGKKPGGADVLMRYTLRLLTAQQFQRAALLFCAMEHLRNKNTRLGERPFRIGLWVGGTTSPNSRKEALSALEKLQKDSDSENPFVLLKCPWCSAKFGPSSTDGSSRGGSSRGRAGRSRESGMPSVLGYQRHAQTNKHAPTVVFRCSDSDCEFGTGSTFHRARPPLPIVVIDEDLLENPPNLVIGTVDKFAMLSWKPEARRLFGIGDQGKHIGPPPSLIIQDELHLISGPLGSMVGAYETVIERLCRSNGTGSIKPKIIASTATISRAREQILHLYAREDIFLFPPSGLLAGDSFFARDARNEDGTLMPGRLYVGVLAPAHGSLQTTEARVFASLLQHAATMETDDAGRDPWWTLLCFFNSLRELGSAASLFVADTRDYLRVILDREGMKYDVIRKLYEVSELTSRIRSDQVPKELERLEKVLQTSTGGKKSPETDAVDACLASNIIEVGVDVGRLALMAIVGQPKTTSQYIQVSSRVGRDPQKPGLVVVLYGQSKPRDRSHYERFRPYHQKLYAQVEPTSVTPFSPPAVDRALHSVVVAAVRQLGVEVTTSNKPFPFPLEDGTPLRDLVEEMLEERVLLVAPEEKTAVMHKLKRRLDEWRVWQPGEYGGFGTPSQDAPLIHPAGTTRPPSWGKKSWPTMSSLRNVDASCEAEVTQFFNQLQDEAS